MFAIHRTTVTNDNFLLFLILADANMTDDGGGFFNIFFLKPTIFLPDMLFRLLSGEHQSEIVFDLVAAFRWSFLLDDEKTKKFEWDVIIVSIHFDF